MTEPRENVGAEPFATITTESVAANNTGHESHGSATGACVCGHSRDRHADCGRGPCRSNIRTSRPSGDNMRPCTCRSYRRPVETDAPEGAASGYICTRDPNEVEALLRERGDGEERCPYDGFRPGEHNWPDARSYCCGRCGGGERLSERLKAKS